MSDSMLALFHKLPQNIAKCFSGYNLLWQVLAIALTYILVSTGFDWFYFVHTRTTNFLEVIYPALIFGGILPVVAPLVVLAVGAFRKSKMTMYIAYMIGQAAILGAVISSIYKAFTGRIHPVFMGSDMQNLVDISHQFQFGFLRGGIFWGWPSTHTTIAFAMAVALFTVFAGSKKFRYVGILAIIYAFYIGLGVSVSIHWFSEFIAGAIIGSVIGVVVGKSFRDSLFHTAKE